MYTIAWGGYRLPIVVLLFPLGVLFGLRRGQGRNLAHERIEAGRLFFWSLFHNFLFVFLQLLYQKQEIKAKT
jgi:hypothetical protein